MLQGELSGQTLNLVSDVLNQVTVGLPIRGVIKTGRSKRPRREGKRSTEKEITELSTERRESREMEERDRWDGQSPERGLVPPAVLVRISSGEE